MMEAYKYTLEQIEKGIKKMGELDDQHEIRTLYNELRDLLRQYRGAAIPLSRAISAATNDARRRSTNKTIDNIEALPTVTEVPEETLGGELNVDPITGEVSDTEVDDDSENEQILDTDEIANEVANAPILPGDNGPENENDNGTVEDEGTETEITEPKDTSVEANETENKGIEPTITEPSTETSVDGYTRKEMGEGTGVYRYFKDGKMIASAKVDDEIKAQLGE